MASQYIQFPGSSSGGSSTDVNIHDSSGSNITLGQKTMANSLPVVIASDQSALPVSIAGSISVTQGTSPWVVSNAGTFAVQAAQSGTWNITNVSGTISLPTGAATEASLVKLPLTQGSTTSGQSGTLVQGAVTTSSPSYTTTQTSPLSLTTAGALRVDGSASIQPISGTIAATQSGTWTVQPGNTANSTAWLVTGTGGTFPVTGSVTVSGTVAATQSGSWSLAANQSVNVAQINGVTPLMGNGVTGTGSQRVTIASDNTAFSVNAVQSGTWNIGTVTTVTGVTTVSTVTAVTAITNPLPAGTNNIGGQFPTPSGAAAQATTNATSTAYEASRVVKASAGTLYGFTIYNSKTTSQFIQVHNTTSVPADTAVPVWVGTVGPSSNMSVDWGNYGRRMSVGITLCNSSTGPTKTIGSADVWIDAQYV